MAISNSHIILKQVLEFVIPKNQNAFEFQQELGELSKKKLEPALEKLFDSYSSPDEILSIDFLEINLGKQKWQPSGDAFVKAVVRAVEEQLKSKISNGNGAIKRKPVDQAIFEEWVYFLENGYYPRGTRKLEHTYYHVQIPEILKKNASFKKQLIEVLGKRSRSLERLIKQNPESFLKNLYAVLSETAKSKLEGYKQEIQRLFDKANSSTEISKPPSLDQSFWKWVFGNLSTHPNKRIEEKEPIIGFFQHWISIQKPNYKKGESSLRLTLKNILQESPGSFPLLNLIREQLGVTVFSDWKIGLRTKLDQEIDSPDLKSERENNVGKSSNEIGEKESLKKGKSNLAQRSEGEPPENLDNEKARDKENREKGSGKNLKDQEAKNYGDEPELFKIDDKIPNPNLSKNEPGKVSENPENNYEEYPKTKKLSEHHEGSFWYVNHAGVVLLHTFLPLFFEKCELTRDKQFIDEAARERAAQLLLYLATGQEETPEYDMVLAKFLCGMPLEMPIYGSIELTETEKSESIKLLQSAIDHWGKLKKTSPDGLRMGFLQRDGKLEKRAQGWYLTVEQRSMDILLNYLPWNLRMVKLPWMEELLRVEWE